MTPFSGDPGFSDITRELLDRAFADIWHDMHRNLDATTSADKPETATTRAPSMNADVLRLKAGQAVR